MVHLSPDQVAQFRRDGFFFPIPVLGAQAVAELRTAVDEHLAGSLPTDAYELTDPIKIKVANTSAGKRLAYEPGGRTEPKTFPFLFNVWRFDERFRRVAFDSHIADIARQLLDTSDILLMEDNVIIKHPHTGPLPWHQDLAYWPITEPTAVTVWIALNDVTVSNGGMQMVPGSQRFGERLPVGFGDGKSLLGDERPEATEVPSDPAELGYPIVSYALGAGEAGVHDPLVWHGSAANTSDHLRCAYALRYLKSGTVWWGDQRMPYDDIGCEVGDQVDGRHFPPV